MTVETLRWANGMLEMIDQRVLPTVFKYLPYDSAASVAEGIQDMVVRGAPAIGVAAAYGVALEALRCQSASAEDFTHRLEAGFALLARSRPTAVNLTWALQRMHRVWDGVAHGPPPAVAAQLLMAAHDILAEDVRNNRALGAHGAALLPDPVRVLTHCNAGALATAGHGTALGVVRSAVAAGKRVSVIATETRPFLQGARLTAWEMVQEEIPVTLITDNMVGHLMATGEVDVAIVGADRVAASGDVVNKIGTYMIAVLAHRHGIPFYVACPISTLDMSTASGAAIPIEERPGEEVTGYQDIRWAAAGTKIRNPAFDVTPADLVTAIITERGVVHQPDQTRLQALFA